MGPWQGVTTEYWSIEKGRRSSFDAEVKQLVERYTPLHTDKAIKGEFYHDQAEVTSGPFSGLENV